MQQTAAEFSPGQILEAGIRAESGGRLEYALQFYRHLVQHYGVSEEALEARAGLARIDTLMAARPQSTAGATATRRSEPQTGPAARDAGDFLDIKPRPSHELAAAIRGEPVNAPQSQASEPATRSSGSRPGASGSPHAGRLHAPVPGEPRERAARPLPTAQQASERSHPGAAPATTPLATGRERRAIALAPVGGAIAEVPVHARPLPRPINRYLVGRLTAVTIEVAGVVIAAVGVAGWIGSLFAPELVRALPALAIAGGSASFAAATGIGVALLLGGGMARALFAASNALQDIAALNRHSRGEPHSR